MSNGVTIFVADDHPLLLKGLVDELKDYNYNVIGTAENGTSALEKIVALNPTVALLDVEMPMLTGFEVVKKCKEKNIDTYFIILTSHKERGFIHKAQMLNISGYMIKDEPFVELHKCIQSVSKGIPYFSSVFNEVIDKEIAPQLQKIKLLSPSERTIVRLVAQGNSSKEIGEQLSVSSRTVEKHRSNIIAKLDLTPEMDALVVWTKENKEFLSTI
ncbi:response regulator transcription factor [Croceitalea vernalis]|uniref:Response regulator transcription factor n=1 Tax=Croceitalea vernalis TaxID=3075599 RepID=A0ABU3BIN8_9FLAO|nr:response regulator transcription factor [Croceitalea sp. P007]MDT0622016.1 response regulator transcription factor [Croceitalea sp. P007]